MTPMSTENPFVEQLGGSHASCRPVFAQATPSRAYVIAACGAVIKVVSIHSGELVAALSGHTSAVKTMILHPNNPLQLVSAGFDGKIIVWDYEAATILRQHETGFAIHALVMTANEKWFVAASKGHETTDNDDDVVRVMQYDFSRNKLGKKLCKVAAQHITMAIYRDNDNEGTEYLLVANKRKLTAFHTSTLEMQLCLADNGSISAIAVCNSKGIVATGHQTGQITLWHGVNQWVHSKRAPTSSTMHWHAHAVADLAFSEDGNYLHSGGEEGVLAVWQLHTSKAGFVPRLGSAITSLAYCPWDAICAVVCADNSVRLINIVGMQIEWTLQGLTLETASDAVDHTNLQVQVHPASGQIACNGYPGHLQFYDLVNDSFTNSQEIVFYTRVSRTQERKMVPPVVDHFAFSERPIDVIGHVRANVTRAGRYMATVDTKFGEKTATESTLKFWELSRGMQEYTVNTQVENPHGSAKITCLKFHPCEESVLTAASDGTVKLWQRVVQSKAVRPPNPQAQQAPQQAQSATVSHWTCGFSLQYRSAAVHCAVFSGDGSILALAQGNVVTLWDPLSTTLLHTFVHLSNDTVNYLQIFENAQVHNSSSATADSSPSGSILVACTRTCVCAWDLLSLQLLWETRGKFSGWTTSGTDVPVAIDEDHETTASPKGTMNGHANGMNGHATHAPTTLRGTIAAAVKENSTYHVRLLDVCTGTVRKDWQLSSKPQSLAFWRGRPSSDATDVTQALGIVTLTRTSELLLLKFDADATIVRSGHRSKVAHKSNIIQGPTVAFAPVTVAHSSAEPDSTDELPMAMDQPSANASAVGIGELFAEHSINLLGVNDIFDAFMKLSLTKSSAEVIDGLYNTAQAAETPSTSADGQLKEFHNYFNRFEQLSLAPLEELPGAQVEGMDDFFGELVTQHLSAVAPRRGRTPHRRPRAGSLAASPTRSLSASPSRASPTNLDIVALTPERLLSQETDNAEAPPATTQKSKRKGRKSTTSTEPEAAVPQTPITEANVRQPRTRTKSKKLAYDSDASEPVEPETSTRKRKPKSASKA